MKGTSEQEIKCKYDQLDNVHGQNDRPARKGWTINEKQYIEYLFLFYYFFGGRDASVIGGTSFFPKSMKWNVNMTKWNFPFIAQCI